MLSYWEHTQLIPNPDFAIIGSGIVGISTAIELRKKEPNARISIFERGALPWGASTKNAGFACFGSPSELLSDLQALSKNEVTELIEMRYLGLKKLLNRCGSETIDYYNWGSNEVFQPHQENSYQKCISQLNVLNDLVYPITGTTVFEENDAAISTYKLKKVSHLIKNKAEGQLNTGKMMKRLLELAKENNIAIYNGLELLEFEDSVSNVKLKFSDGIELTCSNLILSTNGFVKKLVPNLAVEPARAQVILTKPLPDLAIKGTFHFDEGYYYFRNIDNRVLFGGGRNLDFKNENTTTIATTTLIQNELVQYLKEMILPGSKIEIEQSWAGIMGIGNDKKPIIKKLSNNVYCGVKMGGMGIAIGSMVGEKTCQLIVN